MDGAFKPVGRLRRQIRAAKAERRCRGKLASRGSYTVLPRKTSSYRTGIRTKTDTGGRVKYTKARERNLVKELGNIAP